MKKKSPSYDDELDFIVLFKIIWNGKIKIVIITIISFLIGFGYTYLIPNDYVTSLNIKRVEYDNFSKFITLNNLLKPENSNLNFKNTEEESLKLNQIIFDKFIYELKDYEEFLFILEDTTKLKDIVSKIPIEKKKQELFKYKNLLEIVTEKKDRTSLILNLKWHNQEEAKDILQNLINLTLNNLQKSIFKELNDLLEEKRKTTFLQNLSRIEYLTEQSLIAKEFNLGDNLKLKLDQFLNTPNTNIPYFILGKNPIDKEIEIIKKRKNVAFDHIEEKINTLKKENIQLIKYNINSINQKSTKNFQLNIIISALLGLIAGLFYVIISHTIFSKRE